MLKKMLMGGVLLALTELLPLQAETKTPNLDGIKFATEQDFQWWHDARFWMFIHFGPEALAHSNSLSWPKTKGRPNWHEPSYKTDHTKEDELSKEIILNVNK